MKLSKRNIARIAKWQKPLPTESEFMCEVLQLAKLRGWRVAHFRASLNQRGKWQTAVQADGKGFPDLLLVRGKVFFVAELKIPPNKATAEQALWLTAFANAGVPAFVWTPSDWETIKRVLENGPCEFSFRKDAS